MSFNYAAARATAERLIARFGQSATLRKVSRSGTAYAPTIDETDTTITVVDLNQRVRDQSGTLIGQSQRTLYVSTSAGVVPEKDDKVVIGGTEHEIGEVRALSPGGTVVFYEVDLAI